MEQNRPFHFWHYYEMGVRHLKEDGECQDRALTAYRSENGVVAAAVSDGAGSYSYSQYGADIAVKIAVQKLTEHFDSLYYAEESTFVLEMINDIRDAFFQKAEKLGCEYYELSATLLCAAMAEDGRYLYFHVGDGVVIASDYEQRCWIMSQYEHTVGTNFTTFVTSKELIYQYDKGEGGFSGFFLCSDGPEEFFTDYDGACTPELEMLMQMSHLFPCQRMIEEIRVVTAHLKDNAMYDDASYAVIADKRYAGDVLYRMTAEDRQLLLNASNPIRKRFLIQMKKTLDTLSQCDGVTVDKLKRILHIHKKRYVRKRLACLQDTGVIYEKNNKFYF